MTNLTKMTNEQIDMSAVKMLVDDYNFPEMVAQSTVATLRAAHLMKETELEDSDGISDEALSQLKAKFCPA